MSQAQTISFSQMAEFILGYVGQANVKADDLSLAIALGAREFLRAIKDGRLVVTEVAQAETNAMPNVTGSEGIIPASVTGAPPT